MVAVRRAGWRGCSRSAAHGIGRIRVDRAADTSGGGRRPFCKPGGAARRIARSRPRPRHHVPAPTERHRRVAARCRCAPASALRDRSSRSRGRSACLREQRALATRLAVAPQRPRERRLRQPVHSMAVCPSVLTAPHPLSGSRPNHPAAFPPDHGWRSSPRTGQSRPARRQAPHENAQAPRTERRGPAIPSTAASRRRAPRDEPSGRRSSSIWTAVTVRSCSRSLASIAAALVRTLGTRRIEGSAASRHRQRQRTAGDRDELPGRGGRSAGEQFHGDDGQRNRDPGSSRGGDQLHPHAAPRNGRQNRGRRVVHALRSDR